MRFRAEIVVSLKDGLLDPQGKAIEGALPSMGWTNVTDVGVGKHVRFHLEAESESAATAQVQDMAERLLSNPVIESFRVLEVRALAPMTAEDRR